MSPFHLAELEQAVLVVVDMQERMMAAVSQAEAVTRAAERMLRAGAVLGVPVLYTEQNPAGLGPTIAPVRALMPPGSEPICKTTCSAWADGGFRQSLIATGREHVLLAGAEAHVCILQTALDLLRVDYVPFVLADAISSRRSFDAEVALDRMRHAGIVVSTVEAVIFELVARCDVPAFKEILMIVK